MRYVYDIKFEMLQVRGNEISLRKRSGSTARLRTLEETLVEDIFHSGGPWASAKGDKMGICTPANWHTNQICLEHLKSKV